MLIFLEPEESVISWLTSATVLETSFDVWLSNLHWCTNTSHRGRSNSTFALRKTPTIRVNFHSSQYVYWYNISNQFGDFRDRFLVLSVFILICNIRNAIYRHFDYAVVKCFLQISRKISFIKKTMYLSSCMIFCFHIFASYVSRS